MFNNESVLKSIARRVFPEMGTFSADGTTHIGLWDAVLHVEPEVAWLTVSLGQDLLFQIETRGGHVKATYALPAVMTRADGEVEYGTRWANSRQWRVNEWSDVTRIPIKEFFENLDEFIEEEKKVHKIIDGDKN